MILWRRAEENSSAVHASTAAGKVFGMWSADNPSQGHRQPHNLGDPNNYFSTYMYFMFQLLL